MELETLILKLKESNNYTDDQLEYYSAYAKKIHDLGYPIIFDVNHLSQLTGISYAYIYKVTNSNKKNFYKHFSIPKQDGSTRQILSPFPSLKIIQNWILKNILEKTKVSNFAKAYKKKCSLKDNVKFHRKQKLVLKLDIKDFFSNIQEKDVFLYFKSIGYSNKLSLVLTNLVMYNSEKGLPQGAPTSPYMSNIIMREFDDTISKYCVKNKIRYTRYADDLTFSGDFDYNKVTGIVSNNLKKLGLYLNHAKTQRLYSNNRQVVTGIVVNDKTQIDRRKRKNLRLEIYYLKKNPVQHLTRISSDIMIQKKYLLSLIGKLNFALQINPYDSTLKEYKKEVYYILETMYY
ncbi:retron St85 family RNA-directed DNA polymerase (plasmid) [Vagococcus lutrae]|uniref:retron St85 family RNA-directed DNA polymerase n=1 Tax=Vagococcus lutrae TaxID=81947 RepID=UPI002330CC1F|nr:retron St85 family RNA-directed DNA polymerase [Vagococcus lutrae]WCG06127.1 retron St85 family RNA-directed DNA polymerase [Vagococcus lutrae]